MIYLKRDLLIASEYFWKHINIAAVRAYSPMLRSAIRNLQVVMAAVGARKIYNVNFFLMLELHLSAAKMMCLQSVYPNPSRGRFAVHSENFRKDKADRNSTAVWKSSWFPVRSHFHSHKMIGKMPSLRRAECRNPKLLLLRCGKM